MWTSVSPCPASIIWRSTAASMLRLAAVYPLSAHDQGLTLVNFSAHRQRFLWERGCI